MLRSAVLLGSASRRREQERGDRTVTLHLRIDEELNLVLDSLRNAGLPQGYFSQEKSLGRALFRHQSMSALTPFMSVVGGKAVVDRDG